MKPKTLNRFVLVAFILVSLIFQTNVYSQDYRKLSPFSAVRWEKDTKDIPRVKMNGKWYLLDSIENISVEKIISFCKKEHGTKWQKRFGEDLVQILSEMGHPPEDKVSLSVQELSANPKKVFLTAPMTEANRRAILLAGRKSEEITKIPVEEFFNTKKANLLLDQFETELEERFAYLKTNKTDYEKVIKNIREKAKNGISKDRLGIEMQKVIALFIDGHARIEGYKLHGGYLPFLIEPIGEKYVAFSADRSDFVDADFPFITKIDGKLISEWIEMCKPFIAKGSPQYIKRHALRLMRNLDFLRAENSLNQNQNVDVELVSKNSLKKITVTKTMAERSPSYGRWPETESKILKNNIGYLRILRMNEENDNHIKEWIPKFKDTDALILDVRDNGGGSRAALRLLFPYVVNNNDAPHVVNVCACRLYEDFDSDHLDARYSYPEDSDKWTAEEKKAIRKFKNNFQPEWEYPVGDFSGRHYMVLSKNTSTAGYFYSKPVIILMNQKCFSATDIFLSAFKGWRNVTLVGMASGGGSARSIRTGLGDSGLILRLASMVSFQKDGKLYDTNGVKPDIYVDPVPEYFLHDGRDNILEKALEMLKH